ECAGGKGPEQTHGGDVEGAAWTVETRDCAAALGWKSRRADRRRHRRHHWRGDEQGAWFPCCVITRERLRRERWHCSLLCPRSWAAEAYWLRFHWACMTISTRTFC